jgi:N-acetyltransferase 10
MGYGSRALELLVDFYEGKFTDLSEGVTYPSEQMVRVTDEELQQSNLLDDNIHVRDIRSMPPLFGKLSETRPDLLDYVGVSYGLTAALHKFWKRAAFAPVYLRQTPNDLTGEHSCVMLRALSTGANDISWLSAYARDFHKRFLSLLSYQFKDFPSILSLSICESANAGSKSDPSYAPPPLTKAFLDAELSPFDLKRLDSYANNMLDYHVILDMVPTLAEFYFLGRLSGHVSLSGVQQSILIAVGLQRKDIDNLEKELNLGSSQLLAMFIKVIRKISTHFRSLVEGAVAQTLSSERLVEVETAGAHDDEVVETRFRPLETDLNDELREGGREVDEEMREKQRALIDALPLDK